MSLKRSPVEESAGLDDFHRRWRSLRPPLRPHPSVATALRGLLPATDEPVLLLGVTPELAGIPRRTIAVDWSPRMIEVAWPGNCERRQAVLGDWRQMPLGCATVAAAIGDGAITMLDFPTDFVRLFEELRRVCKPGGRAAIRCFATPDPPEGVEAVRAAALAGSCGFHAFKLRLNMAAAAEAGVDNFACDAVHRLFETLFPDRDRLAQASGWSLDEIAEIDAYRGSPYVQCYPGRARLLDALPAWAAGARFVETGGYGLAERCPLLVVEFP